MQALERESRLLTRAMLEEDEAVPARLLAPSGGHNPMQWAWIATFGFAATAIYVLWTGIIEPWQQQLAQAGFGTSNLLSLLFFQGAFWKGWQSMISIFETIAMITIAGLGLFFLKRRKRRWPAMALMVPAVLGVLAVALPAPASAAEVRKANSAVIAKDETVKNDLIFAGGQLRVDGTVEGDLIMFVDGNVRSCGNSVTITGMVGKNVTYWGETTKLASSGTIGGSLMAFGALHSLDGRVGRDFLALGAETYLNGVIGGSMKFRGHELVIGPTAEIHGTALMEKKGSRPVDVSPKAKLASPLEIKQIEERPEYGRPKYWIWKAIWLASMFALGMVLILLFPQFSRETVQESHKYFWAAPVGLVSCIAALVLVILACFTVVGIPLALVSLAVWFLVFCVAQVIVGGWLGELLLGQSSNSAALLGRVAIGMVILRVLFMIPKAGWGIHFLVLLWGFGAVSMALFYRFQPRISRSGERAATVASA